jgi:hypothetical protein
MAKPNPVMPQVEVTAGDEQFTTNKVLPFRTSFTVMARSLMGISYALHRLADAAEKDKEVSGA